MAPSSKEVETDLYPFIKVYKDGTVERLFSCPYVPPSLHDPITGVSSKDIAISPHLSARLYLPTDKKKMKIPVLVYFHSGGFCLDSAFSASHHRCLNRLISKAAAIAVSVEYRLAPEHPIPAAYQEGWEALQWAASHADPESELVKDPWLIGHGDFDRVYLGGDSSGGNIVHNIAMRAGRERLAGGLKISGAFLSFPYFLDSKTQKVAGIVSSKRDFLNRMWMLVHPSSPDGVDNPLINPFADDAPDVSGIGCGKVLVCTSERDELRENSLRYVEVLKNGGWEGEVELVDVKEEDHCFHIFEAGNEKAESLFNSLASFING